MKVNLTDRKIKSLKAQDKKYKTWDIAVSGLYVLTMPSGYKAFKLAYRIGKYQKEKGSTSCTSCPIGFNTKGQRGKKQCFDAITGASMKQLGIYPYPFGWKNENLN